MNISCVCAIRFLGKDLYSLILCMNLARATQMQFMVGLGDPRVHNFNGKWAQSTKI